MPWRFAKTAEGDELAGEATSVNCECCGMAEECTPAYIGRVREHFEGAWVCGLCTEAVKERQPAALTIRAAVEAHAALCRSFNATVRLNPKLSLASSMRDIARKSCQNRRAASAGCCGVGACGRRATSCPALPPPYV